MTTHRSPLFELADSYVETSARMSPMTCTELGIPGFDDQLDTFTIEDADKEANYSREIVKQAKALNPTDEIDQVSKAVLIERLESRLKIHDTKEGFITYSPIVNPASYIRQVFTIMPTDGDKAISNIAARLNQVGKALDGWKSTLQEMDALGKKTARRQVIVVADQLKTYADGGWEKMAQKLDPFNKYPELHSAAKNAASASGQMSEWMRNVHAPRSAEEDAVGEERYKPWARFFTGAELDLKKTYEWGLEDLARINDRMYKAAAKLGLQGKPLKEVAEHCENAELHRIDGEENLVKKLREFTEAAVKELNGKYFDIDPRIAFCDSRIAPEGAAAAPYYIPPSEDLSRPGTTWYPTLGHTRFNFWHIASTWYHEAVPGHHLQVATTKVNAVRLNRFQRNRVWVSGYGEGWALYAERLMDELGAFEDPGYEMGYLSAQGLRAARIVVDIGMHRGYKDFNGEVWNAESAFKILHERALLDDISARSEVDRYLGWPGQAISYKVGERFMMEAREDAKKRLGNDFNLKKFHSYVLNLGPMGLDPFKAEMAVWNGQ